MSDPTYPRGLPVIATLPFDEEAPGVVTYVHPSAGYVVAYRHGERTVHGNYSHTSQRIRPDLTTRLGLLWAREEVARALDLDVTHGVSVWRWAYGWHFYTPADYHTVGPKGSWTYAEIPGTDTDDESTMLAAVLAWAKERDK